MALTQTDQLISITTPLGTDKLLLRGVRGEERISGLFRFDLEMQSEEKSLDFSKIVGKSATVKLKLADGSTRYVNGIVGRFVQAGSDSRLTTYLAELHPWLWLTTMSADCRIWQNKSVKEIVTGLFTELGFTDYEDKTRGTYSPLEYCVQYNETAFAFVSRLLESAGIFYFFSHADGKHTLVLGDDHSAFADCAGAATVDCGDFGNWQQQNVVAACMLEETVISGKYVVDDFGFETPSTDLTGSSASTVAGGGKRRVYEYPGGFTKKDAADKIAKLRMDELEAPRKILRGESFTPAFTAGGRTTLKKHYRDDVNDKYVLLRVTHAATLDQYTNSFDAFPSALAYRPPRTTRKPVIPGTQTAIVVGKANEEIWTDQYGRIKVQFHWDQLGKKDENSSCWIRVAHGWAGKGWGEMFLPRIGQEVVVSFLDGDPDRPLVTGSVYNAEQTVPYTLPADQTKSTIKSNVSKDGGGFNEIRFEDKKDSEEIFVQAQKDANVVIRNNETRKVGFDKKDKGNQTIDVYQDRTVTLDQGNDKLQIKTGNRTLLVDTGNDTYTVAGTRDVKVSKKETHTNEEAFVQKVAKNYTLDIDGDLSITVTGKVTFKSAGDMKLETGGKLSTQGMNISNKATSDLKNEAMNVTNKASVNLTSEGAMVASKASGMHNVEASGILTVKGTLVKIN